MLKPTSFSQVFSLSNQHRQEHHEGVSHLKTTPAF
jgi:hypothetical protein